MRKGISAWAFDPKRPLAEVFALAKETGFDGVEVAIAESGPITPDTTPDEAKVIIEEATKAGVQIAGLASGLGWHYPITTQDETRRRKGIDITAASLHVASYLGADGLLLVPGGVSVDFANYTPLVPYDVAYENALSAVWELASVAEETGVYLGIENVWNKFLLSPLEMRDFLDAAGSEKVGSYFDVGNVILLGYPEQWISILGTRIKKVHFKDFKQSIGTLKGFCDLLDGDVNWPAVMAGFRAIGYDGFVTAEYFNCEGDLKKISEAMDKILGM